MQPARPVRLALLLLPLLSFPALAQTTYHVAPPAPGGGGGDDSNPGTQDLPFATIQRAADVVNPGDTVLIAPGVYAGFNVGRSGTAGSPITFSAQPGVVVNTAAPAFNGQNHRSRINLDSVSWIILEGFEVVGTSDLRTSNEGIRLVGPPGAAAGHITIRNCHVHHNGNRNIFSGHLNAVTVENCLIHHAAREHGVYLSNSGDGHIIRGNVIYSNANNGIHLNADASQGGDGVMTGVLVEGNTIYENAAGADYIDLSGNHQTSPGGGSGINGDGIRHCTIVSNVLYDNRASGISLYRIDGLLPSSHNLVANNTVVMPENGRWALNIRDASTGNTALNNILLNFHPSRGSIDISADSLPGFAGDHNILHGRINAGGPAFLTLAQWQAQTGNDLHSSAPPPSAWPDLFIDLPARDLTLSPASPPATPAPPPSPPTPPRAPTATATPAPPAPPTTSARTSSSSTATPTGTATARSTAATSPRSSPPGSPTSAPTPASATSTATAP